LIASLGHSHRLGALAQSGAMVVASQWNPFVDPSTCTIGQLTFTVCVYGYALFQASNLISDGSELLLLVPQWAPLVGSVVLPVLGAVPDGMMVLFSGLGANAQQQVTVGVGALAGSTIMLLTLPWFLAMFAGRVNMSPTGVLRYKRPQNAGEDWDKLDPPGNMSLTGTGVGVGSEIKDAAQLMLATTLGYFIIQIPAFRSDEMLKMGDAPDAVKVQAQVKEARTENQWALIGLVLCMVSFGYYLYKMWTDSQDSSGAVDDAIAAATVDALRDGKLTLRGALSKFRESSWCNLKDKKDLQEALVNKTTLDEVRRMCKLLAPFFGHYDLNGDNQIDFEEFRMIFKDVRENLPKESQKQMFDSADTDQSGFISFEEFVACMMNFALDPNTDLKDTKPRFRKDPNTYLSAEEEERGSDADDEDDEDEGCEEEDMPEDLADLEPEEQQRRIKSRAFQKMLLGSALVLIFSDPTVDVLAEIGHRVDISPFYVSFVLAPMASNATELVAAYNYAKKRTIKSMTTSLSSLLGAGVMNNTFCLGIFLALIYCRNLAWEFSAETIAIVGVEVVIGAIVWGRRSLQLMHGVIILALYPISLLVVWFLENKVGID